MKKINSNYKLFFLVFFSLFLKVELFALTPDEEPTGPSAGTPPFVKLIDKKEWKTDYISFHINFKEQANDQGKVTQAMRKDFKFKLEYSHNGSLQNKDIKDFSEKPANYPLEKDLFYIGDDTKVDGEYGPYIVILKINENYAGEQFPKNFDEFDDGKQVKITIYYLNDLLDGENTITFEKDKDEGYFLGNQSFAANLRILSGFKKADIHPGGSDDPRLVFQDKEGKFVDDDLSKKDSNEEIEYIIFDVTDQKDDTEYKSETEPQSDSIKLHSRTLNLRKEGTKDSLTKEDGDVWKTILAEDKNFKEELTDQCYFVFPPSSKKEGEIYQCVRCNFKEESNNIDSDDKAYLISSNSFSDKNKSKVQKQYHSKKKELDKVAFTDLDDEKLFAVLPLFPDKTLVRYKTHQDTTSNTSVGSSENIDSRIMCKLIRAEKNYTLGEILGAPQNETDKGDPRCFIVSAAYGSSLAEQVDIFRWLRDAVILKTKLGQDFINFYYNNSQPVADYIASSKLLKFVVRAILWPIALFLHVLKLVVGAPYWSLSLLALLLGIGVFLRKSYFAKV